MKLFPPRLLRQLQRLLLTGLILLTGSTGAQAMDLGVIGPTYEISEPHLLKMIEQRLREKERNGELLRLADKAKARGVETVTHPVPVAGVRTTQTARSFYFDPSFTLDHNVLDAQGQVVLLANGTPDQSGDPLNLTGYTFLAQIRETPGGETVAATFTVAFVGDPSLGTIIMSIAAADTAKLTAELYAWDIFGIVGSNKARLAGGAVNVRMATSAPVPEP